MRRLRSLAAAGALILAATCSNPAPAAPVTHGAFTFTVPGVDDAVDLHGDLRDPQLVLFVGGNQFMVMPALLAAFESMHPAIRRIFYETLPPNALAHQIDRGSVTVGNLSVRVAPDVFESGRRRMRIERSRGIIHDTVAYASNDLAIMVYRGNPKHVRSLRDLGRTDVTVAMPDSRWEGIGRNVQRAYRNAGGSALERRILVTKLAGGTTRITTIHHRQTPRWIASRRVDAGVTWRSEALYQERIGAPISDVMIPRSQNVTGTYLAGVLTHAPHHAVAEMYLAFLQSPQAQAIYRSYGFGRASPQ